jgi:lysophospholipase L1-like esterase
MSENSDREITHYNLGVRRETSEDILQRWESEVESRLIEDSENYVVFSFGVNDTVEENGKERVSILKSVANAKEILLSAKQRYPVIMVGPPPIDDSEQNRRIKMYDKAYKQFCDENFIAYLSVFDTLVSDETWKKEVSSNDGAHPRDKGYKLIADLTYKWDTWWFRG